MWLQGRAASGPDGTIYVGFNADQYTYPRWTPAVGEPGWLAALDPVTGQLAWNTWLPFAEGNDPTTVTDYGVSSGIAVSPIASPKGKGVYVASLNCKLYLFDSAGNVVWWYRLRGRPDAVMPVLADGVLYVSASAPDGIPANHRVCPFDDPSLAIHRYGCMEADEWVCQPCFEGGGAISYLYAFQVE